MFIYGIDNAYGFHYSIITILIHLLNSLISKKLLLPFIFIHQNITLKHPLIYIPKKPIINTSIFSEWLVYIRLNKLVIDPHRCYLFIDIYLLENEFVQLYAPHRTQCLRKRMNKKIAWKGGNAEVEFMN